MIVQWLILQAGQRTKSTGTRLSSKDKRNNRKEREKLLKQAVAVDGSKRVLCRGSVR